MNTEALEFIDMPHRKNYSRTKTCQNCYLRHKYGNKYGCFIHDNKPTRNPRARAVKCCEFWHWLDALDNIMADTLRKS